MNEKKVLVHESILLSDIRFMNKLFPILAVAAGITMALTGCSSDGKIFGIQSDLGYGYRQMDSNEIAQRTGNVSQSNSYASLVQDSTLDVFLKGSSSCPPSIKSVADAEDGSVRITLKDWGTTPCTGDFTSVGYQITAIKVGFTFTGKTIYTCNTETCTGLPMQSSN